MKWRVPDFGNQRNRALRELADSLPKDSDGWIETSGEEFMRLMDAANAVDDLAPPSVNEEPPPRLTSQEIIDLAGQSPFAAP